MADAIEIARETAKAIEASRRIRASMTDDTEDEAREWPPIYFVCQALLAQQPVVEAADAYEAAYQRTGNTRGIRTTAGFRLFEAVRAMREAQR